MKIFRLIFLGVILLSCENSQTKVVTQLNDSVRVIGVLMDQAPVGVWKYYDEKGNVLLKIDYQIDIIDIFKIQNLRKYFSVNGNLIEIEGFFGEEGIDFYSRNSGIISRDELGKLLIEEYCYSCHRMDGRHLAKQLRGYNFSDQKLNEILGDKNHSLESGNFIWENKENLMFMDKFQLDAIQNYIDKPSYVY